LRKSQVRDSSIVQVLETDLKKIAAGLNWVRIPIGFWAIETMPGEPFLPKVSWTYFLKALVYSVFAL
jgi:glucan 1,3-beta-glucosidase